MNAPTIPEIAQSGPDWSPPRPPKPARKKDQRYVVNVQRGLLCLCCRDHEHSTDTYRIIYSEPDTTWSPDLEQAARLANAAAHHELEVHGELGLHGGQ